MRKRILLVCVERLYQECPGGIQLHYVCRSVADDGCPSREYCQFNEAELEKWTPERTDVSALEALKKALGDLDKIERDING